MDIQGKIALVLGANRGIGKAIGLGLAQAGAKVVLAHYDWTEDSARLQTELAASGSDHLAVEADLRDPGQAAALLEVVRQRYGRLHILINNVERGGMPVVHGAYTPEQWDLEMATTLKAKWWVFHHALPLLKSTGDAAVINLSSIAGLAGRSGPAGLLFNDGYAAANRAVSSFTETWARLGAPEVRVNELMLGFIATRHAEGTRGWDLLAEQQREAVRAHTLLRRTGRPDDVVNAVFFLLRDATFMTGSVLRLDGGYMLGGEPVPPMPEGVL